eukprot:1786742-Rhodomonas_salina.2
MPGTDTPDGLGQSYRTVLHASYAMSSTGMANSAVRFLCNVRYSRATRLVRYYRSVWCCTFAKPCPVLRSRMERPGKRSC